jgi:hypothetical protein
MPSFTGARARVAAAALLLVSTGVGFGLSTATNARGATPITVRQDVGILQLHLSNAGSSITYTPPLGVPTTQAISLTGCVVTTGGSLLALTPSPSRFGLGVVSNGLGVRNKNNCATENGQIASAESLTLALGNAFGANVFVEDAELDVEGKHGADLGVALDRGAPMTVQLNSSSDNGPDSGVGDNDRVQLIDQDFRTLTLTAAGGEVSLEGGGAGTFAQYAAAGKVGPIGTSIGSADTIFKLVTINDYADAIDCLDDPLSATLIGGAAAGATLARGLNDGASTPADCEDVGVTFEILEQGVLLNKGTTGVETGAPQAVNAEVEIVWEPQAAQVPLPARQINFEGDPNGVFEPVQWCSGIAPDGDVIHPADSRFPCGVLSWCLVDEHVQLLSDGTVQLAQVCRSTTAPATRCGGDAVRLQRRAGRAAALTPLPPAHRSPCSRGPVSLRRPPASG